MELSVGTGDEVGAMVSVEVEATMPCCTVLVALTGLPTVDIDIDVDVAGGRGVIDGLIVGGGKVGSLVGSGPSNAGVNVGSGFVGTGSGGCFVAVGTGGCAPTLPHIWLNVKRGGGLPALHARPSTSPSLSL